MRTSTLDFRSIKVGDAVAPMTLDLTATFVVAGAVATRDFMPVHHDRDDAASQGSPNIFLNILSDTGFCTRFLTDWAGPEAAVKKLAIRLDVPAYAGSKLEYTGSAARIVRRPVPPDRHTPDALGDRRRRHWNRGLAARVDAPLRATTGRRSPTARGEEGDRRWQRLSSRG